MCTASRLHVGKWAELPTGQVMPRRAGAASGGEPLELGDTPSSPTGHLDWAVFTDT